MIRAGNLIERIADLDNLRLAFVKARRGKQYSSDVLSFADNIDAELLSLRESILSGDVSVGNYHTFEIYDPKQRTICAAAFRERVLHHAIMNICHPIFERHFIFDTYATRKGKGQYAAIGRAMKAFCRYDHVLKLDFRKYFDSIPHKLLKCKLLRLFKDKTLLKILFKIIDTYSVTSGCGLPIGNLTSQYFANYFLSDLDHYAKETLKIPCYIRYMDDILIFEPSKQQLKNDLEQIKAFAAKNSLVLKPPVFSNYIKGVQFLGYKLCRHKIILCRRSRHRFESKYYDYQDKLLSGVWSQEQYQAHILPLMAFVEHSYSKRYRKKIITGESRRSPTAFCVGALGTTTQGTVAYRIATTTPLPTVTTTTVCALP